MLLVVVLVGAASVAALWFLADRYGRMLNARREEVAAASAESGAAREVAEFLRVREEIARAVRDAPAGTEVAAAAEARERSLGPAPLDRRRHDRLSELYRAWLADPAAAPRSYAIEFDRHRERLARASPPQTD
jgi:hypothetical protein